MCDEGKLALVRHQILLVQSKRKARGLYVAARNSVAKIAVAFSVRGRVILERVWSMLAGSASPIARGSMTNWSREQPRVLL